MLLVDANVLLYAVNAQAREHDRANKWLNEALSAPESVGLSWVVLLAFIRIATMPAVFPSPLDPEQAGELVESWVSAPSATVVEPTARHLPLLRGLLAEAGTAGNLVSDAHLAALALEHDATVASFDRDFGRFSGVRSLVPG